MINKQYIDALKSYQSGELSGQELLALWETAPEPYQYVYYNLHHLVSDEDIRAYDESYKKHQLGDLAHPIECLEEEVDIERLKSINFFIKNT